MNCVFPNESMKAVISYLRRIRQTVVYVEGEYALIEGIPNIDAIRQACEDGAVSMTEDGSILLCGIMITSNWDTVRIRRRIEDHLRKSASKQDIIRIAACLGVTIN